jgi:hypothetical protein
MRPAIASDWRWWNDESRCSARNSCWPNVKLAEMTEALRGAPADAAGDSVRDAWRDLETAGGVRPDTDVKDELLQLELDQARRKAAVDEQLAFLKKKMGKE